MHVHHVSSLIYLQCPFGQAGCNFAMDSLSSCLKRAVGCPHSLLCLQSWQAGSDFAMNSFSSYLRRAMRCSNYFDLFSGSKSVTVMINIAILKRHSYMVQSHKTSMYEVMQCGKLSVRTLTLMCTSSRHHFHYNDMTDIMIAIAAITIVTLTISWGCHDVGPVISCVMVRICHQSWH